ncbi:ABC transporter ATP-binding protein [Weissella cibaria]|uniref:ABC transporter ATP-binding protein n=1 Tax=Weissella cibaria TaxID=137591 RepID=UPI002553B133|nr:ABC transporter ATP-binding protein [Weissella cibaria]MDK9678358.1 ABC transporter ATP-binding protein [Weissella cibaria]
MRLFFRLKWFIRLEWRSYLLGILALLGVAMLGLIPPIMIGRFANLISERALSGATLCPIIVWIAIATVGQYLLRFGWSYFIWGTSARLERLMRLRLLNHYLEMDKPFFQKHRTGDLLAHATNDINQLQRVAGNGVLQLFDALITGVSVVAAMAVVVNPLLTIRAVVPLLGITLVAQLLGGSISAAFSAVQDMFSQLNNKTQESLMGIKVLKTVGEAAEDTDDFQTKINDSIRATRHAERLDSLFNPAITILTGISFVGTIIYGGYLVQTGALSIGSLITFVTYLSALVWPFLGLGFFFNNLQRGNAAYERITTLLAEQPATLDKKGLKQVPRGDLQIDLTTFQYPDATEAALQHVHVTVQAGNTLGLVGPVGSGKSTLIQLLLREFDQYVGNIKINQIDIREYDKDTYLPAIGYVPQDNFLFSTSVLENIRFADPNISLERVQEAARWAALHDDIMNLPDGYDTQVGEQGISLSGGQRQRLAIARALIINPDILILDDALSAVDAKTEQQILTMLHNQRRGKTTIIATHRLSAVVQAAETLVFEHGRVEARGTHSDLIQQGGWYARMFAAQQLSEKLDQEVTTHG